jgi:NADH dehydrogenase (ubiquinone) 1 alpha/beta subcomplex 1
VTEQQVEDRVIAVFKNNGRLRSVPLQADTPFDQLRLESLDVICILFDLEEEFRIQIPDRVAGQVRCIGDVVKGVLAALKAKTSEFPTTEGELL